MKIRNFLTAVLFVPGMLACEKDADDERDRGGNPQHPVFLVIDAESIDNGNGPNNFSATDVNDQPAEVGERRQLSNKLEHLVFAKKAAMPG